MLEVFATRLDYLSVTFHAENGALLIPLFQQAINLPLGPAHSLHGMQGLASFDAGEGGGTIEFFSVGDGSGRLHVRLSGAVTEIAYTCLLQLETDGFNHGNVTRYDVAIDGTLTDESYSVLAKELDELAQSPVLRADGKPAHTVQTEVAGDWFRGLKGRTLYIGARSSSVRARFYEKGKQLDSDPGWCRFEWQVRPARTLLVADLTYEAPSDRYALMVKRLTGMDKPPTKLRGPERDRDAGGLRWLERMAVAMLRKATPDEREQWILRVQAKAA